MSKSGGFKLAAILGRLKTNVEKQQDEEPVKQNETTTSATENREEKPACPATENGQEMTTSPAIENNHDNMDAMVNAQDYSITMKNEFNNVEAMKKDNVDSPVQPSPSSGRKNRRKNSRPKNISSFQEFPEDDLMITAKDDLEQYQMNNQGVDFHRIIAEEEAKKDGEDILSNRLVDNMNNAADFDDDSFHKMTADEANNNKVKAPCDQYPDLCSPADRFAVDTTGAMDLSVGQKTMTLVDEEEDDCLNDDDGPINLSYSTNDDKPHMVTNGSKEPNNNDTSPYLEQIGRNYSTNSKFAESQLLKRRLHGDANDMKNYAQSTMSELLSIYGLSEEAEAITKTVPLQNFSSGTILDREGTSRAPTGGDRNKAMAAIASTLRKKTEPGFSSPHLARPHSKSSVLTPGEEGVYAKFIDSVSRLAKLPQGHVIGNPPVLLPQKASVLLKLAAVGSSLANHAACSGAAPSPNTAPSSIPVPTPHSGNAEVNKFVKSSAYVKSCFDPEMAPKSATSSPSASSTSSSSRLVLPDYAKYVKHYSSYEECGGSHCRDMSYREHFHCMDCSWRVFVKKEEMIRHFKWHKKRDESLQHGFMRYSPMDDCVKRFGSCTHNHRQTHYHCLQPGCNKVYISTSDVQMHANYHRKDSAIIQEGFQRFRATEDCGTLTCSFYGQRTTHFHCRRSSCTFTFKNKADMEKHKTYHQKDEALAKDGFKKYMKYEACPYAGCKYSKISNHIHCIRSGCDYVLHSTGQLYSHKRKHERRDFEHAYRRFKSGQQKVSQYGSPLNYNGVNSSSGPIVIKNEAEYVDIEDLKHSSPGSSLHMSSVQSEASVDFGVSAPPSECESVTSDPTVYEVDSDSEVSGLSPGFKKLANEYKGEKLGDSLTLPIPGIYSNKPTKEEVTIKTEPSVTIATHTVMSTPPATVSPAQLPTPRVNNPVFSPNDKRDRDEVWKQYLTRFTANDPCHSRCVYLYKDHYHCQVENCGEIFKSKDGVREHARYHDQLDAITKLSFQLYQADEACFVNCVYNMKQSHFHCLGTNCNQAIAETDPIFTRLEHYKKHEFHRTAGGKQNKIIPMRTPECLKRKRGRPPKYPKNEIPVVPKVEVSNEELDNIASVNGSTPNIYRGFKKFEEGMYCPDEKCMYYGKEHFHCVRPRCHHASDRADVLSLHARDFHNFITILEGFEFFDRNVNCRRPHCHNNKANRHFHCVRPKCDYSFVRYSTMSQHDKKHKIANSVMVIDSNSVQAIGHPAVSGPTSPTVQSQTVVPVNNTMVASPAKGTAVQIRDSLNNKTIKASGTFFPLSTVNNMARVRSGLPISSSAMIAPKPIPILPAPSSDKKQVVSVHPNMPAVISTAPSTGVSVNHSQSPGTDHSNNFMPLTVLLQQKAASLIPQLNWLTMKMKMHYGMGTNCGRPFCKLKKKDHFHCYECNQAFSDPIRLKAHITKHGVKISDKSSPPPSSSVSPRGHAMSPLQQHFTNAHSPPPAYSTSSVAECREDEDEDEESVPADFSASSSSLNLKVSSFVNPMSDAYDEDHFSSSDGAIVPDDLKVMTNGYSAMAEDVKNDVSANDDNSSNEALNGLSAGGSRRSGRKRTATKHDDFVDSDTVVKQRRMSSPRSIRDDSLPSGFIKFHLSEDCQYEKCSYKLNTTHYHCSREDCGFGVSDKSRLVQHLIRHDRIDKIMGEDFEQFRSMIDCQRADCEFSLKSSHFHCVKCPFICLDTSKIPPHRKHHERLEYLAANGFVKFTGAEDCGIVMCHYYRKQTHYHCMEPDCRFSALGPAQIAAHRQKHISAENAASFSLNHASF